MTGRVDIKMGKMDATRDNFDFDFDTDTDTDTDTFGCE